jgi:catechol 2,3-dioxygenase-like lactoylglutathione lyase family enzyme
MTSHLYHLQINIDFTANAEFYKELMELLGWSLIFETDGLAGYKSGTTGDLWFVDADRKDKPDYDAIGTNHVGIRVEKKENIDEVVKFIEAKDIKPLFETPRHRAEFAADENSTYYQVMFESKDGILFEIVYIGAK